MLRLVPSTEIFEPQNFKPGASSIPEESISAQQMSRTFFSDRRILKDNLVRTNRRFTGDPIKTARKGDISVGLIEIADRNIRMFFIQCIFTADTLSEFHTLSEL